MHASISAHIAADYLLDEASAKWGPSLEEFERRLGTPATKSHLENLYFAYLFVLRAVMKAGPALEQANLSSGLPVEDKLTRELMDQLVSTSSRSSLPLNLISCPVMLALSAIDAACVFTMRLLYMTVVYLKRACAKLTMKLTVQEPALLHSNCQVHAFQARILHGL